MLSLNQCLGAHRPLIFAVAESDMEVLQYLNTWKDSEHKKPGKFFVYSTTLATTAKLDQLLSNKFQIERKRPETTIDVLNKILDKTFDETSENFETYVFLDADSYIHDKQNIRKIKDILSRYQMDESFIINMIFISQTVSVPMALERLGEVVFFDLPGDEDLLETTNHLIEKLEVEKKKKIPSKERSEIANNLKGLTLFEVEQAFLQSFHIYKEINIDFIHEFKKSAIAKTDLLSLMEANVTFDDVGGMPRLKEWIKQSFGGWTVEGKKFGLPQLKGLLLVGPPGTGKSLLAKSIGNEWKIPVIQFNPAKVFSSRVGDSEENIQRVLKIAENTAPCILFIDEIEKGLAGMQSSTFSDSGVTARVIGSFLTWFEDCTKPVFTVATSNAIHYMPPELISRFDETFFINIPQFEERKEIFNIHLKKLGQDPKNFHIEQLATQAEDLAGREIKQALHEAMYVAFATTGKLSTEIIIGVLDKKTNLVTTMAEQLDFLLKWVGWDEKKKDGIRARFASPMEEDDMGRIKDQIEKLIKDIEKDPGSKKL